MSDAEKQAERILSSLTISKGYLPFYRRDGFRDRDIEKIAAALAEKNAEIERLSIELAKVNNEFGSETANWPDAWSRVADLKTQTGVQYREIAELRAALQAAEQKLTEGKK